MQMKKKLIEQASDAELQEFAELTLQLPEAAGAKTRAEVLALIGPAWAQDYIFVEAAEMTDADETQSDEVRAAAQVKLTGGPGRDDPKWLIRIAATELPGGKDPVPVGVNGHAVVIQRNMEAEVPHRYVVALQNAIRTAVHQDQKTREFSYSNFTNYPIEIIQRPSRAEIEEWHERTKDQFAPA